MPRRIVYAWVPKNPLLRLQYSSRPVHAGRHILTVNDVFEVLPVPALSFRQRTQYGRIHHGSEDRGEIASTEHSD